MRIGARIGALAALLVVAGCGGVGLHGDAGDPGWEGPNGAPGDGYDPGDYQRGEKYGDYGENPFVDPAEDPLATFGVDVDTASYAIMRRDVNAGLLPVPEGVRAEEYVNYFDYGYEPPSEGAFAVHLEAAPSYFGPQDHHLLRIGIKGEEIEAPDRGDANLVFLVDTSCSMGDGSKLPLVKSTLTLLLGQLRPDDRISIVTYAGSAGVLLEPTPASDREAIEAAIHGLATAGSTNGEGGIRKAYDLAVTSQVEGGINRVILCTDGDFNVGLTDDALVELIEQQRDRGIYLSTLGFGAGNYNDYDMERLADHGNGNYAYIDSLAEAERVVRRDLLGTMIVIAQDVKIQVAFDPAVVKRYRLIGYENRAIDDDDFEDPRVDTGDIGSGHDVTALVELELRPGVTSGSLATVNLRYKNPGGHTDIPVEHALAVEAIRPTFDEASEAFRLAAAVAEYAEILRRSEFSEGERFDEVIDVASSVSVGGDDRGELVELVGKASLLAQGR